MKTLFLFFFMFAILMPRAHARSRTEWSLHLDTKLEGLSYPQPYGDDTNSSLARLELDPIYEWKYPEKWKFYVKPVFVTDPTNKSTEEQIFFDLGETYLRYTSDTASIKAGSNIFSWGVTDGYNPLDTLNPKQYFDPLHSRKLGAPSLELSFSGEHWDLELIYIPKNQSSLLPGTQSRWLPREIFVPTTTNNGLILNLPEQIRYHYSARETIDQALDHNGAIRLQRHGDVIDFSLSYYEGVASFPIIQPVVTGTITEVSPKTVIQVDPDVTLNSRNYRIRQGGFTFVSNQMNFLLKFATSYTQSFNHDSLEPGWTHENVLGLEKTFNIGEEALLIVVLQHSFINSQREDDSNLSVLEIFRRAWMIGGKLNWREVWNFSFLGLYDSQRQSHFEEITLARRFFDVWNISISGDFIQGDKTTPLGVYDKNDSYSLSVSRSF